MCRVFKLSRNGSVTREVRVENKMHWKSQAYIKFGFWTKNYLYNCNVISSIKLSSLNDLARSFTFTGTSLQIWLDFDFLHPGGRGLSRNVKEWPSKLVLPVLPEPVSPPGIY